MLPKRKKIIVPVAVLAVIIGAIVFLTPSPIPEEEAIAKVRIYLEGMGETITSVCETELRPPTEEEQHLIQANDREPPSLIWYVRVELYKPGWLWGAQALLDAYTGEILSIVFLT